MSGQWGWWLSSDLTAQPEDLTPLGSDDVQAAATAHRGHEPVPSSAVGLIAGPSDSSTRFGNVEQGMLLGVGQVDLPGSFDEHGSPNRAATTRMLWWSGQVRSGPVVAARDSSKVRRP